MESQSKEENQQASSPNKPAGHKVFLLVKCVIDFSHIQNLVFWKHTVYELINGCFYQGPAMPKMPQMDLIAELKKRQVKSQVREGTDGALEDIITGNTVHYLNHMVPVCSAFEIHLFCLQI